MSANQACFPIAAMARVLGVSKAGYYAWLQRPPSARATADAALLKRIKTVHASSRQTYGAPRVHADLHGHGERHSRKRIARLMREAGGFEVVGQPGEVRHDSRRVRYSHCFQPGLACRYSPQRRFPALLELRGDQPIVGIAGSIAPLGERGLVAGLLQFQLRDALSFALVLHMPLLGLQCRLNRHRLYGTK